jgi:hypothetical protein
MLVPECMYHLPPGNVYSYPHSIDLRPTDEVGEDGWQFILVSCDVGFETIASVIPTDITFNKLAWASEFRCVSVPSIPVNVLNIILL